LPTPPEPEPEFNELSWLDALPGSATPELPSPIAVAPPAAVPASPVAAVVPAAVVPAVAVSAVAVVSASVGGVDALRLPIDLSSHLDIIERGYIEAALRATGGNKQASADLLGLQRTTLVAKCKKHGLEDTGKSNDDVAGPAGLRVELAGEQRPQLLLRGAAFKVAVIREDSVELVPLDGAAATLGDTSPVAGSCVVDGETLRLFGALRGRGDGAVVLELAIPLERAQLVTLQRGLVKRRPRVAKTG